MDRSSPSFYNRNIKNNELCNRDRLELNKSRGVWRGRSPSILNPQLLVRGARGACARGARAIQCDMCGARMNFREAGLALREQKFFHCAFAAREPRRGERQRRGGSRKGTEAAAPCGR